MTHTPTPTPLLCPWGHEPKHGAVDAVIALAIAVERAQVPRRRTAFLGVI